MTSKGLGEMYKGDSADTCAGKFPLVSLGGRANGQACEDCEGGPPLARAEILDVQSKNWTKTGLVTSKKFGSGPEFRKSDLLGGTA
jgi:hypothetical protein